MAKPLHGQFEQESNSISLKRLNLGIIMKHLDQKILGGWLEKKSAVKKRYPDVAKQISQWVIDGNWSDTQQLVTNSWIKS